MKMGATISGGGTGPFQYPIIITNNYANPVTVGLTDGITFNPAGTLQPGESKNIIFSGTCPACLAYVQDSTGNLKYSPNIGAPNNIGVVTINPNGSMTINGCKDVPYCYFDRNGNYSATPITSSNGLISSSTQASRQIVTGGGSWNWLWILIAIIVVILIICAIARNGGW